MLVVVRVGFVNVVSRIFANIFRTFGVTAKCDENNCVKTLIIWSKNDPQMYLKGQCHENFVLTETVGF